MIKRVISADNVMETALVRPLLVERESNSWTLKVFTSLPQCYVWSHLSFITDFVLTKMIISILIHVVNVLHLTSPAGRPFVTPWHSITRELSLCGNLSRAQRRVSVTAQLAPRAGRPQVATAGTVSFHSDLPPAEPQLETPGSPPERGPMVSPLGDSYRWQQCMAPQCTWHTSTKHFTEVPEVFSRGSPSPKATTVPLPQSNKINIKSFGDCVSWSNIFTRERGRVLLFEPR